MSYFVKRLRLFTYNLFNHKKIKKSNHKIIYEHSGIICFFIYMIWVLIIYNILKINYPQDFVYTDDKVVSFFLCLVFGPLFCVMYIIMNVIYYALIFPFINYPIISLIISFLIICLIKRKLSRR